MTKDWISWGGVNIPFDVDTFDRLYDKVAKYLSNKEVFVRDCYACPDKACKLNIRVINEFPWSNMFLRPTEKELDGFEPEWTVVNAPGFMANPEEDVTR